MASRAMLPRVSWSILQAGCWGGRCSLGGSSALQAQKEEVKVFLIFNHETLPMASQESGSTLCSCACQTNTATDSLTHSLTHHIQMKPRETRDYVCHLRGYIMWKDTYCTSCKIATLISNVCLSIWLAVWNSRNRKAGRDQPVYHVTACKCPTTPQVAGRRNNVGESQ